MATPLSADRIVAALRAEGLRVVEHGSWRTHNRNHRGPWGPVHGVMVHHTVTSGTQRTVDVCYDGYAGLPGPLCLGVIAKDGTVYLVGNGRANHAGLGDDDVLAAVIAERSPLPAPNENNTDGNARFYGFECENLGDGKDPWPAAQLDAIERAPAAICRAHGWNERSVIGHKEWTNTKIDPRGFSMDTMRGRIAKRLDDTTTPTQPAPAPEEDNEMQLSDQVPIADWIKDRWPDDGGLQDGKIWVQTALGSGYAHSRKAAENSEVILALVKAQGAAIGELAKALAAHHQEIDADALVARITQAIESVTVRLDVAETP